MSRRLLDKDFHYTPSFATNVRKTIKREQDRIKAEQDKPRASVAALPARKASSRGR